MLKPEQVQISHYRTSDGFGSIDVLHLPTGIKRGGSLKDTSAAKLSRAFAAEIEAELLAQGLHEYVLPITITRRLTKRSSGRRLRRR